MLNLKWAAQVLMDIGGDFYRCIIGGIFLSLPSVYYSNKLMEMPVSRCIYIYSTNRVFI